MNKQELIERIDSKMFAYPSIEPETEDDTTVEFKKGFNCACENIKRLADQKLDEPEKVVVPKFVAKKIESYGSALEMLANEYFDQSSEEVDSDELACWIDGNADLFFNAWVCGYEVEKEQLYWAVRGVTDYFRCDEKIIVFKKEEEALEVANLIGINTEVKKMDSIDCSECISIEELRNENEEPLFYVALPKIGDTEFCYLWTDTDGAVYTQGNKGLCIGRLKHTEQEIKAIDERYWLFAVKVDGE